MLILIRTVSVINLHIRRALPEWLSHVSSVVYHGSQSTPDDVHTRVQVCFAFMQIMPS